MTAIEKMSLSDDLGSAALALEKALLIWQEIKEHFFDLNEKTDEGAFAIRYNFHRYAVFADLLGDLLTDIAAILPSSAYVDDLKAEDEEATKA